MNLAAKLTGLFLLLALLPLAVVAWLAYDNGRKSIEEDTRDALMSVARLKSAELERWIEGNALQLRALAQRPAVREYASVEGRLPIAHPEHQAAHAALLEDHLQPALAIGATRFIELFLLAAADGMIHVSTNQEDVGKYREDRAYFIEGKRETYVQNAYFSMTGQDVRVTIGTPIADANGDTIAVLAGHLDLEELAGIVATQSGIGASEDSYLVNRFNFFVTDPRHRKDAALKAAIHTDGVADCLQGKSRITSYLDYSGVKVFGAYRWLPERELCILTELDRTEALAPVTSLARRVALAGGLAALAAAVCAALFARTVTGPIRRLAAGAREIGRGNLDVRVRMKGKDEIAQLSRTFDLMAADLKMTMASRDELEEEVSQRRRAEAELERESRERAVLAEISRIIGSTLDIHEVYGPFAEGVRKLLPFDWMTVDTIDVERGQTTIASVEGEEVPGRIRSEVFPVAGSVTEAVVKKRSGIVLAGESPESLVARFPGTKPRVGEGARSWASAPLISEDSIIGVLHLISRQSNAYTEEDLVLAERVGTQIAGAVANAQLHAQTLEDAHEREVLAEIGRVVNSSPRVDEAYDELARLALTLVPYDRVAVARRDRQKNALVQEYSTGVDVTGISPGTVVSLGRLDVEDLYPGRRARIFDRDALEPIAEEAGIPVETLATPLSSAMSVPLVSGDEIIGNMTFRSGEADAYDERHLALAERVTGQIAGAVARSQLLDVVTESLRRLSMEVAQRAQAEEGLRQLAQELEDRVGLRTVELEAANKDLEAFAYSVSHDLRAPLRAIEGFSHILEQEHGRELSEEPRRYLRLVGDNVREMVLLIDDLLALSRLGRQALKRRPVEPADIARRALADLADEQKGRRVEISLGDLPSCKADPALLKQVFVNLLSNALKFTRSRDVAEIEIGSRVEDGEVVYFVRDNGVGFDMRYADRVFGVFQRLRRAEEYEGSGVGLAIVQRIVRRHEGRVWVEAEVDQGATFSFVLGEGATNE